MRKITYRGPAARLVLPSGRVAERDVETEATEDDVKAVERSTRQQADIGPKAGKKASRKRATRKQTTPAATGEGQTTTAQEE